MRDDEAAEGRHRAPAEVDLAVVTSSPEPEPEPPEAPATAVEDDDAEAAESRHWVAREEDIAVVAATPPEPEVEEAAAGPVAAESDIERLHRLLAFVVRQEPRLNWAVGNLADGTTLLVTDLAYGWIPSGITLPAGVRLLPPGRHIGKASALLGEATQTATYTPGDPVGRPADFAETEPSVQARELPAVEDLGWELGRVTHWRDGLPRLVHTLARAATAGTGVVEEEARPAARASRHRALPAPEPVSGCRTRSPAQLPVVGRYRQQRRWRRDIGELSLGLVPEA